MAWHCPGDETEGGRVSRTRTRSWATATCFGATMSYCTCSGLVVPRHSVKLHNNMAVAFDRRVGSG